MVTERRPGPLAGSEGSKSVEYVPQQALVGDRSFRGHVRDFDHPVRTQIAEQNADHTEREVDVTREVHDGHGPAAHAQKLPVLGAGPEGVSRRLVGGHDDVDQAKGHVAGRDRPPFGHGIGPDDRARVPVEPAVLRRGHAQITRRLVPVRGASGAPPGAGPRA